ncbi:cell elongation-specific peptidoglycan biosynthesis regulator RodA [Fluviicoccus keumensis]|uniref:Peptidoglycan glycosyltransferase MrdB n=1 Tax=Fluviicoccus keumensis TaxID=1435465 RepID=A0A4Q7YK66_9GAMM|nr:rod shape-determining protein RodA [Fluviicoccus keumensis]RZU37041.1 cell elongation-specific peptidoglycan biosynthesis regulator RodA [Fluviicoccus keumensis]
MNDQNQYRFQRQAPQDGSRFTGPSPLWARLHIDVPLLVALLLTAVIGLIELYSATGRNWSLLLKQVASFGMGIAVLLFMAQIPPRIYQAFSPWLFGAVMVLLVMVALFGTVAMGARRWLTIPGVTRFQPSEFMKLAMPMMMAWYLAGRPLPPTLKVVALSLILILAPALLIARQPDLGTAILVSASGFFVLFLAGLPWWLMLLGLGSAVAIAPFAWHALHDYQKQRILTLFDPEADPLGTGWNIIQSKTAIGSGGLLGKGWLKGSQAHLEFLPEGHTDFVIAAYSEEFGLMGILVLLALYSFILTRCLYIATTATDSYSRLLAGSIALSFFVYVFVNAGMVSGIVPVVGVPLPFISYGGTAIITLMTGFGMLMSIHTHKKQL